MHRHAPIRVVVAFLLLTCGRLVAPAAADAPPDGADAPPVDANVTQGALRLMRPLGDVVECPLEHTVVQADVAGFVARVRVTQTFHNPTDEPIEAVYVFPLPHEAAVDQMTMHVGDRKIVGLIKRRADARDIYQQALRAGQTAALLEQERPNIFTQSVGNIAPGQRVRIEISYVDVLAYDMGTYEFRFPMVVGPRFIPGNPTASPPEVNQELKGKVANQTPDTDRVPDASRINPPVLQPGQRTGHDIALSMNLNAGVPVHDLSSPNHRTETQKLTDARYTVKIAPTDVLPNKDFVLRYKVMGKKPEVAVLAHQPTDPNLAGVTADGRPIGGHFMLMVQPKEDERLNQSPPREIVFLVDVSGSMSGQPTAKVIEAMRNMLKLCRADRDTVQVITFAGSTQKLFDKPLAASEENVTKALRFTDDLSGSGGTNMLEGVKAAIDEPLDAERIRIVVMLTDGFIGNESEIIEHVGKHCGDRVRFWCIGIGSSVNQMLVDGVAKHGGGTGKILGLNEDAVPLTQEVMTRIQRAQLANVTIDWGKLDVSETYPAKVPELWSGRPIVLFGTYRGGGGDVPITIRGDVEGQATSWNVNVNLPAHERANDQLTSVWARKKIEDLMQQTYYAGSPAVEEMVTQIALDHRLMSQYTSFVAVDQAEVGKIEPSAKPPRRMLVPVPLPAGTRFEGFFGGENADRDLVMAVADDLKSDRKVSALKQLQQQQQVAQQRVRLGEVAAAPLAADAAGIGGGSGAGPKSSFFGFSGRHRAAGNAPARPRPIGYIGGADGGSGGGGGGRQQSWAIGNRSLTRSEPLQLQMSAAQEQSVTPATQPAGTRAPETDLAATYQAAQQAARDGRHDDAARLAMNVYLLDLSEAHVRGWQTYGDGLLQQVQDAHDRQVVEWTTRMPALGQKLDLVVRDQSLKQAIEQIDAATELTIDILPGALDDAAAQLLVVEPRVSFVDLRHATVAQALDWVVRANRLDWWLDGDRVIVGAARQREGERAWVYDAAAIAVPDVAELRPPQQLQEQEQDPEKLDALHRKQLEAYTAALDTFAGAVRKAAGAGATVAWIDEGQLLLIARADGHAKAAELIRHLADPQWTPPDELKQLHADASRRATARTDDVARQRQDAELLRTAERLDVFSWQLLAAAAGGELDLEALTELQIAWRALASGEGGVMSATGLPKLPSSVRLMAMRSAWVLRQLPQFPQHQQELDDLRRRADHYVLRDIFAAAQIVQADPQDRMANRALLYGLMAYHGHPVPPDDAALRDDPVAMTLLRRAENAEANAALLEVIRKGTIAGEDDVVLAAVAARRVGGEAWRAFRERQAELLGKQSLPGSVVVLVNRLDNGRLVTTR